MVGNKNTKRVRKPASSASKLTKQPRKTKQVARKKRSKKKEIKKDHLLVVIRWLVAIIIATVLVLIFGIFLPKLEREARENQRKEDVVKISNAVVLYQRNHANDRVNLPSAGSFVGTAEFSKDCLENSPCGLVRDYLNDSANENNFKDPDGAFYNLVITDNLATTRNASRVFQLASAKLAEEVGDTLNSGDKEGLKYNGEGYEFVGGGEGLSRGHAFGAECQFLRQGPQAGGFCRFADDGG